MASAKVQVRRAYEDPAPGDGTRVLVDRIWPRGLIKARAALDEWCTEIAPSTELRKWYVCRFKTHRRVSELRIHEISYAAR